MSKVIWVILGGGLGAGIRYIIASSDLLKLENGFPLGTFLVNLLGCFLIGLLWHFASNHSNMVYLLVVVGFLGGFTTFSSFGLESFQLFEAGKIKILSTYILLSNILGFLLVYIGNQVSVSLKLG